MRSFALAPLLALAACSLRPYEFGASATDTSGTSTTADTTVEPTTSTPASLTGLSSTTTSSSTTATTTTALPPSPDAAVDVECDVWLEDCPEGQKCMPYDADNDSAWESLHCVDIVPNPDGVGEPCTVFGPPQAATTPATST